jgi:signal transduction histidine kinase/ActR/RegA family two-component response regulator
VNREQRILVLAPSGRDADLIGSYLGRIGVESMTCQSWPQLEEEYHRGAAAILVSEEALDSWAARRLHALLQAQPAWSDLPVLLLIGRNTDSAAIHAATRAIGNVAILERPMRIAALLSAASHALRARQRQYESRRHLLSLERAAADLKANERQLREAHARKDEFLATLAHELRNPLAPIRNAVHILRRKANDDTLRPLHDIIDRQLNQMVRLVDDLLEVSRITRGKVNLNIEHLDIASILRGAIETSRPLIDAARHQLDVELPAEPLYVEGDGIRLGQVFANLLNNAAKYTEDGGHIRLSARCSGEEIEVVVEDDGVGIEPGMVERVFDIFAQVRDTNARAQGGLGIGLTLVRSLLTLHSGRVTAHSLGKGKGSRFTVHLPVARARGSRPRMEDSNADLAPTELCGRVIVVDDNRDAADTLAMALRQHGATVQTTYCAEDALAALSPESDLAVIADLGMPEFDGFELARRIRANARFAGVRLVALSGWGQLEDRARAEAAGFDAHFTKPADIDALVAFLAPRGASPRRLHQPHPPPGSTRH